MRDYRVCSAVSQGAAFELSELVERAGSEDRYVVLLAGPCGECGRLKSDALEPLLENPKLRLWSHLVSDVDTISAVLRPRLDKGAAGGFRHSAVVFYAH